MCVCVCVCGTESRQFGYEARLRTQRDVRRAGGILIPDPSQTALASDVVVAWQVYVKIVSVQHEVYLQVWRPAGASQHLLYTAVARYLFPLCFVFFLCFVYFCVLGLILSVAFLVFMDLAA